MISRRIPLRFLGFFFLFVSNEPAFSQDLSPLPSPHPRSGVFIEGGLFKPFKGSWKDPAPDFNMTIYKDVHFRIGYDRFFRDRPLFLRVGMTRREIDIRWSLESFTKNQTQPAQPPSDFALNAEQGITETSIGLGYRVEYADFVPLFWADKYYLRPALNIGLVSKGKAGFMSEISYADVNSPPNASITVKEPRFVDGDLSLSLSFDLQAGIVVKYDHEIGIGVNFTQYGLFKGNWLGFSEILTSSSTFTIENQEYVLRTGLFLQSYSLSLHYRYRFNMN